MKFSKSVPPVNTRRLAGLDFCYDVTLSRWRPWRPPATRCCSSVHWLPAI